ncbi:hypothetical protein F2P56_003418 [Juglans regia]|uniref:Uncharacterized protein n=1 Tax=Juglans regia TaxID=51240 RepID=A0A834D6W4_JUGRE|nr:hypothetical protein F2P56_003418 [Juglans regia]
MFLVRFEERSHIGRVWRSIVERPIKVSSEGCIQDCGKAVARFLSYLLNHEIEDSLCVCVQVSRKVYAGVVLGQSNENKLILAPPRCHKQLHRRQVPIAINNVIGSSFPQLLGASLQKLSSEATGFWAAFALIKRKLLLVFFNF